MISDPAKTHGLSKSAGGSSQQEPPHSLLARAKINLTLEIKGKRADGYHEIESLVMFADLGDVLHYCEAPDFDLHITGPFAQSLGAGDNLIKKAWLAFQSGKLLPYKATPSDEAQIDNRRLSKDSATDLYGAHFQLEKHIPVAAGLGGGSADAAAALRLMSAHLSDSADLDGLLPLARSLGADVPACLYSRPCMMAGIGDQIQMLPSMPSQIPAVLVNPLKPLSTAAVFQELSAQPLAARPKKPFAPSLRSLDDLIAYVQPRSNDLMAPACRLMPIIGDILSELAAFPEILLARLSGSGPTCFALCRDEAAVIKVETEFAAAHPDWWVRRTALY